MVRLATIEISAAPIAPMIAAALPPPGVALPPASSSRKRVTLRLEIDSMVNACRAWGVGKRRGGGSCLRHHRLGDRVDRLGVELEVVLLEQARDAGAVQR